MGSSMKYPSTWFIKICLFYQLENKSLLLLMEFDFFQKLALLVLGIPWLHNVTLLESARIT